MLNWLSDTLGSKLLLASTADAVEVSKSAEVELLAVVWEVRESVYISSPSLSSSPQGDSGENGMAIEEGFWISRGICHHRGLLPAGWDLTLVWWYS